MGCLGRHIAITPAQMRVYLKIHRRLFAEDEYDPESIGDALWEEVQRIEEGLPKRYYCDTDKAWDAIHRTLTGDNTAGGQIELSSGSYPLKLCIMGGELLNDEEDDNYTITLIRPKQVKELAPVLAQIKKRWMRERFFALDAKKTLYPINEDEFDYTWANFRPLVRFFSRAATDERAVLFTVSL